MASEYSFRFILPYKCLLVNAKKRCHWRVVHKAEQAYKNDCCGVIMATLKGRRPMLEGASLSIEWYGRTGGQTPASDYYAPARPQDHDNAHSGLKMMIDALVATGVVPNDSLRYISDVRLKVYPKGTKEMKDALLVTICAP